MSTASGASGDVKVGAGSESSTLSVSTGAVTRLTGTGPAVIQGDDALAPGLLGLRFGTSPITTQGCSVPSGTQWFAGVGSGPAHDSVIELVNPDSGPANADITLYSNRAFTRRQLHGITIPANRTVRLDLGQIAPKRALLSAQVQVTRGRLAVHVLDRRTSLVTHRATPRVAATSGRPRPRQPADRPPRRQGPAHPPARQPRRRRGARRGQDHHRRHELRPRGVAAHHDPRGLHDAGLADEGPGQGTRRRSGRRPGDGRRTDPGVAAQRARHGPGGDGARRGHPERSRHPAPGRLGEGRRRSPPRSTSQRPPRARRRSRRTTPTASSSCTSASASRRATPWRSSCPGARRT